MNYSHNLEIIFGRCTSEVICIFTVSQQKVTEVIIEFLIYINLKEKYTYKHFIVSASSTVDCVCSSL